LSKPITISYPTKLLEEEKPLIRESVRIAFSKFFEVGYFKSLGVLPSDPLPLRQWRMKQIPCGSKGEGLLSKKALRSTKRIFTIAEAESIAEGGAAARDFLKKLTLRGVVERLVEAAEDDEQLEQWLRRLLAPFDGHDNRFEEANKETQFLMLHWIQENTHPEFFRASLCFYSNRALAQAIHYRLWGEPLPATRLGTAEKTAAKRVERLGLRPAKKRIFREMPVNKHGLFCWEPFKERLA